MAVDDQSWLEAPFDIHFTWFHPSATQELLPAACQQRYNDKKDGSHEDDDNQDEYTFHVPSWDVDWFAEQFDLYRLEDAQSHLWLAGRPTPPRPLLYQKSAGREIHITDKMDMHLLWESKRLYLRPIPSYIFSNIFWQDIIRYCGPSCSVIPKRMMKKKDNKPRTSQPIHGHCKYCRLYITAMGFLHSYIALIPQDMDFRIAKELGLVPSKMSWEDWRSFVSDFLTKNPHNLVNVHRRFFFGELRLARLNKIYKFIFRRHRGYRYKYHEYGEFTSRYLGSIAVFTGYVVVALTAMQVGLSNEYLLKYDAFQRATYQFTIFSILGPLALLALVLIAVMILVLLNLVDTRKTLRKRLGVWECPKIASLV